MELFLVGLTDSIWLLIVIIPCLYA